MVARRAHRRPGRRRGRADRQPQRLALLRRPPGRARADARHPGGRRRRAPWSTSTSSAARTSWSSTAPRSCSTPTAGSSRRGPQFKQADLIIDIDIRPVFRKRLLDPRGRATAPPLPEVVVSVEARPHGASRAQPEVVAPLSPVEEVYEALVLGTGDYVRKNGFTDAVIGLSGGVDSSLVAAIAADALGPDHVHGVLHAVALLQRGVPRPTPSGWPTPWASSTAPSPSSRPTPPSWRCWPSRSPAWTRTSPRRTSRPGCGAMTLMALSNKFGLAGAGHRQQERDGRRLLHPLRRHGRRLRRHQGRVQAAGLRPVPRTATSGRRRPASPTPSRPTC